MSSLILELQRDAYDSSMSLSKLLRKAYIVARKLNIIEFEKWISSELNGYKGEDIKNIPEYRTVRGNVRGWNPYHGWIPVIIEDEKTSEILSKNIIPQSVLEIEILANSESDHLIMKYPQSTQNYLSEYTGFTTDYQMHISKTKALSILEAVRNIVLEQTLKFEKDGIIGEGQSFTQEEKETAKKNQYTINIYKNISNSQIQQNTNNSSQYKENKSLDIDDVIKIVEVMNSKISDLNLEVNNEKEILEEIQTIRAQLESPKPKNSIIKESLKTIRNVLEGMAGSLIAPRLIMEISKLIQQQVKHRTKLQLTKFSRLRRAYGPLLSHHLIAL